MTNKEVLMDELARKMGFANAAEMHRMVAEADLSTPEARKRFDQWKREDGTKVGLDDLNGSKEHDQDIYDESMDGDHESALESVYGPND